MRFGYSLLSTPKRQLSDAWRCSTLSFAACAGGTGSECDNIAALRMGELSPGAHLHRVEEVLDNGDGEEAAPRVDHEPAP